MDEYPDEDEMFEIQHMEEMNMMPDDPGDDNYDDIINAAELGQSRPISQINQGNSEKPFSSTQHLDDSAFTNSPHLSRISYESDEDGPTTSRVALNRRLFTTPKAGQRGASTPLANKQQRLSPIHEDEVSLVEVVQQEKPRQEGLGKRRLERDLFGDIDDLYANDNYEDPMAKKARTDEERDMEIIEKIMEARRRMRDNNKQPHTNELQQLLELQEFKRRNLSLTVPQWPSLPLLCANRQRIFVRFHNEDYENRAVEDVRIMATSESLLGAQKPKIWTTANEIMLKRMTNNDDEVQIIENIQPTTTARTEELWVEKYRPRKYMDLLSDETSNRNLLTWLKMWDRVVFGREFKTPGAHAAMHNSKLSYFNKRTGKFDTNGGWLARKARSGLNTNVDEMGRPVQKVALLCGAPGVGKTTLAHTIARHAGYVVREINASDDRSPEAFKMALENGTEMTSVLNENKRPNCIILDEIDGAPKRSIEFLIRYVSDNFVPKTTKSRSGTKAQRKVLRRPIICICNDLYEPALRPLRQIAFVIVFPPISPDRLADRLLQISQREHLKTDFGSVFALAEKSGNDVRSCISTMQFFRAQNKPLTLNDVLNQNLGQKDRHQGLFDAWGAIFRIQRAKYGGDTEEQRAESAIVTRDMTMRQRSKSVLETVRASGDSERLLQGVYENFLQQRMPDSMLNGIVDAMQWFCFNDSLQQFINHRQNYAVYPYLQYAFVAWHLIFATLAWPKLSFPKRGYEFRQKVATHEHTYQSFLKGISAGAVGVGRGSALLLDTVASLKRILAPTLRTVPVQLFSSKEKGDLDHTIDVMLDFGIRLVQLKSAEGPYVYHMEPDLDNLVHFTGFQVISLPYFSRQLIARELDLERIRRATPKFNSPNRMSDKRHTPRAAATSEHKLPNHLQKLQPKPLKDSTRIHDAGVTRDIFGRAIEKEPQKSSNGEIGKKINELLRTHCLSEIFTVVEKGTLAKSNIIYVYKEGYTNAVRKTILFKDLL